MVTTPYSPDPRSGLFVLPPDRTQAILRISIGALMIVAGIACQVAGRSFPYNAPVEMIMNFGITLVLAGGGIALVILGIVAGLRPSVATRMPRISPLALVAVILIGIAFIGFLLTLPSWAIFAAGEDRARFDGLTGGLFYTGLAWGTGIVFGAVALRARTVPSRVLGSIAVGLGLLLSIPAIAAAAVYSAGLTD